jgi:hypothetical protein
VSRNHGFLTRKSGPGAVRIVCATADSSLRSGVTAVPSCTAAAVIPRFIDRDEKIGP